MAEVLITLAIIGIVAALTIPGLVQNIQTQQYKATWKKTYSSISQIIMNYIQDHDAIKGTNALLPDNVTGEFKPYFNASKVCQYTTGCWHDINKWSDFSDNAMNQTSTVAMILSDGTLISFGGLSHYCTDASYGLVRGKNVCGQIWADVNGFKGPNKIGVDIFGMWIQEDAAAPFGTSSDLYSGATNCQKPNNGRGCSAQYLFN